MAHSTQLIMMPDCYRSKLRHTTILFKHHKNMKKKVITHLFKLIWVLKRYKNSYDKTTTAAHRLSYALLNDYEGTGVCSL